MPTVQLKFCGKVPVVLWVLVSIYFCASLIHFAHNAEYISDYPNLPDWLTRSGVYTAWMAITALGVSGVVLLKLNSRLAGLLVLSAYATLGFAGLDHYWAAPFSAHTLAMNLTIWFEALAGGVLLLVCLLGLVNPHFTKNVPMLKEQNE